MITFILILIFLFFLRITRAHFNLNVLFFNSDSKIRTFLFLRFLFIMVVSDLIDLFLWLLITFWPLLLLSHIFSKFWFSLGRRGSFQLFIWWNYRLTRRLFRSNLANFRWFMVALFINKIVLWLRLALARLDFLNWCI